MKPYNHPFRIIVIQPMSVCIPTHAGTLSPIWTIDAVKIITANNTPVLCYASRPSKNVTRNVKIYGHFAPELLPLFARERMKTLLIEALERLGIHVPSQRSASYLQAR